jgi:predicted tellurium resistance membrane protein TerC
LAKRKNISQKLKQARRLGVYTSMDLELVYSCITLTIMELVLGIDNIIFVSLLSDKLPEKQRLKARNWGIGLSVLMRIALLFLIGLILKMQHPLFYVLNMGFSGKDLLLIGGGLFLLYKTTVELIHKLRVKQEKDGQTSVNAKVASYGMIVTQIIIVNLVFSIDTILTAVGLVESIFVMAFAVIASSILMLLFAKPIVNLINKYPGFKIIAFLFLIFIGVYLILEGFHFELSKTYLYTSMVVAIISEWLSIVYRKNNQT